VSDLRTALIIDDEEPLRRLLARVLERAGFRAATAADAEEGLQRFQELASELDLVLLDVVLPTRGAEEILPELLVGRPDLAVILTSGDALPESLELVLGRIRGCFLRKPFAPGALLRAVEGLVGSGGVEPARAGSEGAPARAAAAEAIATEAD
jgi:DNA-binding NtrC family response regulator